jgi:hypothetical protein
VSFRSQVLVLRFRGACRGWSSTGTYRRAEGRDGAASKHLRDTLNVVGAIESTATELQMESLAARLVAEGPR